MFSTIYSKVKAAAVPVLITGLLALLDQLGAIDWTSVLDALGPWTAAAAGAVSVAFAYFKREIVGHLPKPTV